MNKTIAVLVNEINADYSLDIIESVKNFYSDKNVNLVIFPVRNPNTDSTSLDYHFWSGIKLLASKNIDAVIVLTPIFLSKISKKYLTDLLKSINCKNIVSLSVPLDIPGSVSTFISSQLAYDKIIKHLKEEHGCKKIAFMSATETGSEEALDRYESFLKAMKNNNLEFNPKHKFEGFFVYDGAFNTLREKYTNKREIDFDAIVAVNDMMAFACIDFLSQIRLRVPDDVKVIGFDDITKAQIADLSLSTVNQQIALQGKTAADLALKLACGIKVPEVTKIDIEPIFRHSCGCKNIKEENDVYKKVFANEDKMENISITQYIRTSARLQKLYFLLENVQKELTLEQLFSDFQQVLPKETIPGIAICLYDKPVYNKMNEEFSVPQKAKLVVHINKLTGINDTNLEIGFNPTETFMPDRVFDDAAGMYMCHPIFFGRKQFGYFICKIKDESIMYNMIYQKVYSDIISQAYIYSEQIKENAKLTSENLLLQLTNSELSEKSKTDVLTGVFNRRGFLDAGQDSINLSLKLNMEGLVCFGDMDNLKYINDTYGHEMGDKALKTMSQVLQTAFRKNDIVGRLGGDEFAAVLPGLSLDLFETIRKKIDTLAIDLAKKNELPFKISMSIGAVTFAPEGHDLNILLKLADELQYIEKRKKHAGRKK